MFMTSYMNRVIINFIDVPEYINYKLRFCDMFKIDDIIHECADVTYHICDNFIDYLQLTGICATISFRGEYIERKYRKSARN